MGVGDSLEASFPLRGPLPAGTWQLIGDGILAGDGATRIEVSFELLWRKKDGAPGSGQRIARLVHTFLRDPGNRFGAIRYEGSAPAEAVPAEAGDLLVLRLLGLGGDASAFYILNGDGARTGGRIPRIDLPR